MTRILFKAVFAPLFLAFLTSTLSYANEPGEHTIYQASGFHHDADTGTGRIYSFNCTRITGSLPLAPTTRNITAPNFRIQSEVKTYRIAISTGPIYGEESLNRALNQIDSPNFCRSENPQAEIQRRLSRITGMSSHLTINAPVTRSEPTIEIANDQCIAGANRGFTALFPNQMARQQFCDRVRSRAFESGMRRCFESIGEACANSATSPESVAHSIPELSATQRQELEYCARLTNLYSTQRAEAAMTAMCSRPSHNGWAISRECVDSAFRAAGTNMTNAPHFNLPEGQDSCASDTDALAAAPTAIPTPAAVAPAPAVAPPTPVAPAPAVAITPASPHRGRAQPASCDTPFLHVRGSEPRTVCCNYDWRHAFEPFPSTDTSTPANLIAALSATWTANLRNEDDLCSSVRNWRATYLNFCNGTEARNSRGDTQIPLKLYRARLIACNCGNRPGHPLAWGGILPNPADRCSNYSLQTGARQREGDNLAAPATVPAAPAI